MDAAVKAELIRLMGSKKKLTPKQIVTAGKNRRNPLHAEFARRNPGIWNDTKAAQMMRERVAREILQDYQVVVNVHNVAHNLVVRGAIHDPDAAEASYVSSETLQNDPRRAKAHLTTEAKRARSVLESVRNLAIYWKIEHSSIDRAVKNVSDFIDTISPPLQQAAE